VPRASAAGPPSSRAAPGRRRGFLRKNNQKSQLIQDRLGEDGPLAASTCQTGVLKNHQEWEPYIDVVNYELPGGDPVFKKLEGRPKLYWDASSCRR
jgi:hypothetical protein